MSVVFYNPNMYSNIPTCCFSVIPPRPDVTWETTTATYTNITINNYFTLQEGSLPDSISAKIVEADDVDSIDLAEPKDYVFCNVYSLKCVHTYAI